MKVQNQAQANELNTSGKYGPYLAANGHMMVARLTWPKDEEGYERNFEVGDDIRYSSWDADCHESCRHDAPPEDW